MNSCWTTSMGESQKLNGTWKEPETSVILRRSGGLRPCIRHEWWDLTFFLKGGFCGHQVNRHRHFFNMMKIRDLNLPAKLERHHVPPLGWQDFRQSLCAESINRRAGQILKCRLFTGPTCARQPKALLWEQWLLLWAKEFWAKPKP